MDRIQPALKLSELTAKQVRASLQLPYLESIAKRTDVRTTHGANRMHRGPDPSTSLAESTHSDRHSAAIVSVRDLGGLIRAERKQRRLSQQAFADLVGVGRRFVSELENGKATLEFDKVLQVASATGIDVFARRR